MTQSETKEVDEAESSFTVLDLMNQLYKLVTTKKISREARVYFEIPYDGSEAYITGLEVVGNELKLKYEGNDD